MRTVPQDLYAHLDALLDAGIVAWVVAIELTNGAAFYLTLNNEPVQYKGITWMPWPMKLGDFEGSGEGDLPGSTLTMSNVGRIAMTHLEQGGWDQADIRTELVYLPDPTTQFPLQLHDVVQAAVATHENVTLSLAQPNYFQISFPPRRFLRAELFPGIPRNAQ